MSQSVQVHFEHGRFCVLTGSYCIMKHSINGPFQVDGLTFVLKFTLKYEGHLKTSPLWDHSLGGVQYTEKFVTLKLLFSYGSAMT